MTSCAVVTKRGAVDLLDIDASRLLMKSVDILRDYAVEFTRFLHLGELNVSCVGLYALTV